MSGDVGANQTTQHDPVKQQAIQVLSDTPKVSSDDDALDFLPYAQALAFLIDRKDTATPLIIAISAPWGAGKTTLARLVQRELQVPGDWDESHIICSFNAWNHDDAPQLGAAFAADVAQSANQYRPLWRRVVQPLPSVMLTPEQSWRRKLNTILFALAVTAFLIFGPEVGKIVTAAAQPTSGNWKAAERAAHGFGLTVIIFLAVAAFIYPRVLSGTQAVARFIKDPETEAAKGSMVAVRAQLGRLIRQATGGHRRFVIVVDDLERCRPPRAVEVCEVASQLLDHDGIVTILVADMNAIAMSAAIKYRALEVPDPGVSGSESLRAAYMRYGRGYLQKLVQIQFDLPPATPDQLKRMLIGGQRADGPQPRRVTSRGSSAGKHGEQRAKHPWWRSANNWVVLSSLTGIAIGFYGLFSLKGQVSGSSSSSGVAVSGRVVIVAAVPFTIAVIASITAVWQSRRRRRTRALREKIDVTIRKQSPGTTVEEALESISQADQKDSAVSVEKRYFSAVMDPLIVRRADELVFEFLPRRPRAAKRLLNQVRLMISIAIARGLFVLPGNGEGTEGQEVLADRVGKWLVLRERWPEVAAAAGNDVTLMNGLESIAREKDVDALSGHLKASKVSGVEDLSDLWELLMKEPKFGDISDLTMLSGASPAMKDLSPIGGG